MLFTTLPKHPSATSSSTPYKCFYTPLLFTYHSTYTTSLYQPHDINHTMHASSKQLASSLTKNHMNILLSNRDYPTNIHPINQTPPSLPDPPLQFQTQIHIEPSSSTPISNYNHLHQKPLNRKPQTLNA